MIEASRKFDIDDVSRHYDDLDDLYQSVWGENLHHGLWRTGSESREEAIENLVHEIATIAGIKRADRVCDIGCGYGGSAQILADQFQAHVEGFTISEKQFDYASRRSSPNGSMAFRLQDWHTNNLPSERFDHAIMIESSEHSPDKDHFFREAYRVLRPGGRLAVCAWLAGEQLSKLATEHLVRPICTEGRLPGMGTFDDYQNTLEDAGFEIVEVSDWSQQVKKTWSIVLLRTMKELLSTPSQIKHFFKRYNSSADFGPSLFRIRLAYEIGAMKYGFFLCEKPNKERFH